MDLAMPSRDPVRRTESDYYRFMEYDPAHVRKVLSFYIPLLTDHSPVLELGCGRGEFLGLLADAGVNAQGVDNDEGMIEQAREAGCNVALGDAIEYLASVKSESFSGVFCSHFIEHLPTSRIPELMENVSRVLAPGGRFIGIVPNPACYSVLTHDFWRDPTHERFYDPSLVAFYCSRAGLSVERIGFNPENHPGPPPDFFCSDITVHPDLHAAISDLARLASRRMDVDHRWNEGILHVISLLSDRLQESQESLKSLRAAYHKLLWGMYQANDVYVLATRNGGSRQGENSGL